LAKLAGATDDDEHPVDGVAVVSSEAARLAVTEATEVGIVAVGLAVAVEEEGSVEEEEVADEEEGLGRLVVATVGVLGVVTSVPVAVGATMVP